MNMPKMNGQQFVAEIRKHPAFDRIRLIIYSTSKPDQRALAGADGFILKPTKLEELCLEIAKVIRAEAHSPAIHSMTQTRVNSNARESD